ncbi:hypothetical protein SAY86_002893 [Trapa natans]|uniref:CLAVATA3/ESR (CLE)-related protein 25-like n=1 Tax=Trapa natans TaxID=22666 RepID=A0AAN7LJY7_TRANT|nr:hypothetical protein SAY86_002893 [Trapa natans]
MGQHSHRPLPVKATPQVAIAAGFVWLLLFVAMVDATDGGIRKACPRSRWPSEGKVKANLVARHPQSDLNYTSKRRVPNGPDPIHNK